MQPIWFACIYRTRSTAQNQFEETKTTEIRPRCSLNEMIWYTPKYNHIVSFQDSSRKPFSICLSRTVQGMNIYQLIGTSRRLLIGANNTGELGCFESQCNHLTLYFEIVSKLPPKITYRYRSAVINSKLTNTLFACIHNYSLAIFPNAIASKVST